jgi:hypothetical protein
MGIKEKTIPQGEYGVRERMWFEEKTLPWGEDGFEKKMIP